jgi:hypothetical protein
MDTSRAGSVRRVERPCHPVATTGARMLMTLVHERRRRGGGLGVAAM